MSDESVADGLLRDWEAWFKSGDPKFWAPIGATRLYLARLEKPYDWLIVRDERPNPYDYTDEPFYSEYEAAVDKEEERRLIERGAV